MFRAYSEAGGLTPHEEMAPALALLPRGKHVFLKGVSHAWPCSPVGRTPMIKREVV